MRRWPLLLALAAVGLAQAVSGVPQRIALWKDTLRFARLTGGEARARAAYAPASWDLLEEIRRHTPPTARILLVTARDQGRGDPDDVLFHRALVHLYPRAVRWVKPAPGEGWPVWWSRSELEPSSLRSRARLWRATAIVAVDFSPREMRGIPMTGGALLVPLEGGR